MELYGLDPARPSPAHIVTQTRLREHGEQSERLIAMAGSGLETLFRQVARFRQIAVQKYVLLLADTKGATADCSGDSRFDDELRRACNRPLVGLGQCPDPTWVDTTDGAIIDLPDLPRAPLSPPEVSETLAAVLAVCGGNMALAARRLGVGRSTFLRRARREGVLPNGSDFAGRVAGATARAGDLGAHPIA
ncbi:MAG: helix-turn-helix domain-containing protein [Cypionkella sp.]